MMMILAVDLGQFSPVPARRQIGKAAGNGYQWKFEKPAEGSKEA
jgi:hypothetical protein